MKITDLEESKRATPVVYYDRFLAKIQDMASKDRSNLERLSRKMDEFLDAKAADPTQRFGASDSVMSTTLKGLRHFHVSRNPDIVVIYTMTGGKIGLIDIVDHNVLTKNSSAAKYAKKAANARPVREE